MMMIIIMKSVMFNLIIKLFYFLVIILYTLDVVRSYKIPEPTIELLSPRGFRISIQDEPGIVLFGFHGKKNTRFYGSEAGDILGDVTSKNSDTNRWVYENRQTKLDSNDILYYWIYVQNGVLGYVLTNKEFRVPDSSTDAGHSITDEPIMETESTSVICEKSITTVQNELACKGALIFEDEFNSDLLGKWHPEVRIPLDSEDAEFLSYQYQSDVCYTDDSKLFIQPKPLQSNPKFSRLSPNLTLDLGSSCTGMRNRDAECKRTVSFFRVLPPVVSCKLNTLNTFKFKYGTIEIRAKLPKGDWMFPELYLEPVNKNERDRFASGLIRIAFIRANRILNAAVDDSDISGNILSGGVVLASGESNRNLYMKNSTSSESHWGNDYHTYRVIWTNSKITLSVDNEEYGEIDGDFQNDARLNENSRNLWLMDGHRFAPFNKEFYISLGVGIGGMADFPDDCITYNHLKKPWVNNHPKAELQFWNDIRNWNNTWARNNFGLEIDYVKVWAI